MYPVVRVAREILRAGSMPPLGPGEVHVTPVTCWPWDIDVFMEMNNGRYLTLFDLGRFGLFRRLGIVGVMRRRGWYGTVAGSAVRYRRRVTVFQRLEIRTRVIGWDDRFTYVEQGLWRGGECCAHAMLRTAVTTGKGFVAPAEVAAAMGLPEESPPLPDWVEAWSRAEALRPWPPMQDQGLRDTAAAV